MNNTSPAYAIVTPAHNEAHFLPEVIDSIATQTLQPERWVIVDDRSMDNSAQILEQAAHEYPFIQVIHLSGDKRHKLGAHVVDVVKEGLKHLPHQIDFLVKMDADVLLPKDYFARVFARFKTDPTLGIAAGKLYTEYKGHWIAERYPDFHVPGLCKTYRTACFDDIGGLIPLYGWDILDCTKARMLGWGTRSFNDLVLQHLRMTGSKGGMLHGHIGHGRGMWAINAHPLFVIGRALYRSIEPPYLTGLLIMLGYLKAGHRGEPQLQDRELVNYLRKEQLGRLLGKRLREESLRVKRLTRDT